MADVGEIGASVSRSAARRSTSPSTCGGASGAIRSVCSVGCETIDAQGRVALPGFVSAYNHLGYTVFRGRAEDIGHSPTHRLYIPMSMVMRRDERAALGSLGEDQGRGRSRPRAPAPPHLRRRFALVLPACGHRAVAEVERQHIAKLHLELRDTSCEANRPTTARSS